MKKEKIIKTNIRFDKSQSEYTVAIQDRKRRWWLLLLLLLLLPLLINLKKDITVCVLDDNDKPVNAAKVEFNFVASHLYKRGKFFVNDVNYRSERTNIDGICVFKDCPYSVYGMIFKMFHKSRIVVSSDCIVPLEATQCYYYIFCKQTLYVTKEIADIAIKVLDSDDNEPISGVMVHYRYRADDQTVVDSARTNAAGYIMLRRADKCGKIEYLRGSAYGYVDDEKNDLNVSDCVRDPSQTDLLLEPIKESVTFFVTNCNSRQPLPGAVAKITVSSPRKSKTYDVSTNTDGRGRASWQGFHILAEISAVVSKPGFKDGTFKRKYTVEQFAKLPDSLRTICLDPNPRTFEFVNIDTLTNKGIKGVRNEITVVSANRSANLTEFSGTNGAFSVEILEGDAVDIVSEKNPDYYPAKKHFTVFSNHNVIYMMPCDTMIILQVSDANDRFPVIKVTDVHVKIHQSRKQIFIGDSVFAKQPVTNWNFSTRVFYPYDVSVEVNAAGYKDNDYQISSVPVKTLLADPVKCNILMDPLPLVCTGQTYSADNKSYLLEDYDMSGYLGEFSFTYNTYSADDSIKIYDAPKAQRNNSNRLFHYGGSSNGERTIKLKFTSPLVTVEVLGYSSVWIYKIECP
jgi:hypothetical protein